MNKLALIIGITSQDGAYLSKYLIERGYEVVGTTRNLLNINKLKYLKIDKVVKIIKIDLFNEEEIYKLFSSYKFKEIYNLASQSSVAKSYLEPYTTLKFNTLSVLNILDSIRKLNYKPNFLQAVSSEIYGNSNELPITENSIINPQNAYAISKSFAYYTVKNYRENYNLFATNAILFNHDSFLRDGNFFIKKIIMAAVAIKKGKQNEIKVGNLDIVRDFGYAPSYVEAMWKILQADTPNDYIVCSGSMISLREIIYFVFDKLGISREKIIIDPSLFRPVEIDKLYGSNSKIKKELSWDYTTSFFDILELLIEEEVDNSNYNFKYES